MRERENQVEKSAETKAVSRVQIARGRCADALMSYSLSPSFLPKPLS